MKNKNHKSRVFLTIALGVMLAIILIGCKKESNKSTRYEHDYVEGGRWGRLQDDINDLILKASWSLKKYRKLIVNYISYKPGKVEKDWIEIRILDEMTGKPMPQREYTLKFDDGSERKGITNDEGFLFEDDIPSGKWELILDGHKVTEFVNASPYKRSNIKGK